MTLRSIEKLREWSHKDDGRWLTDDGEKIVIEPCKSLKREGVNVGECLRGLADEIEREIAEKYILLPVDADGVPIRVGDMVKSRFNDDVMRVGYICEHGFMADEGSFYGADFFTHAKPDAVKELLREFLNVADSAVCESSSEFSADEWNEHVDGQINEYAERIREAVSGE